MTDVNQVVFTGGRIKTSEDLQSIRASIEEKEFDMLVIDKQTLLSLFEYVDYLQGNEDGDLQRDYELNG